MNELVIAGFRGIVRQTDSPELEKAQPVFLAGGQNAVMDLYGNAYVMTGFSALSAAFASTPIYNIHYSPAIRRILCSNAAGDLYSVHPTTGAITTVAGAFAANAQLTYGEWPQTARVYISDGTSYKRFDGAALSANIAGLGNGTVLHAHKNHMFAVHGVTLNPSTVNDPETFSSGDGIICDEGGDVVTALTTMGGVLHAHKRGTIYQVTGEAFAGTAKDPQRINLNTGRGAVGRFAAWVEDGVEYFIAFDGLYRGNGPESERISKAIDGSLAGIWDGLNVSGAVCPFVPTWGPDAGSRYILFLFSSVSSSDRVLWRYCIDTGDWMRIVMGRDTHGFAHSSDYARTWFADDKMYQWDNVSTFAGSAISGAIITNPIDAGTRLRDKPWSHLHMNQVDHNDLTVTVGYDGLFPSLATKRASDKSVAELPRFSSHLIQVALAQTGGGRPISSGFSLYYDGEKPDNSHRDAAVSRRRSAVKHMADAPLIKSGTVTLTAGQATATVTHGMGVAPQSVFACHQGWTGVQLLTLQADPTATSFTIVINGFVPLGGEKIHWFAIVPEARRLFDSYLRGGYGRILSAAAKDVFHNLSVTPGGVFVMKYAGAGSGLVASNVDGRRMTLTPQGGHADAQYRWSVLKQGTTDTWFRAGSASSSPITHGLGATPGAVFLWPNQGTVPNHGITSFSSTQIVYAGSGDYYWAAFQ